MARTFQPNQRPLSAKPLLGEWKLTASAEGFATDVVATFEVEEYVLPRYEVVIDVPPTISEEEAARGVTGKIHGRLHFFLSFFLSIFSFLSFTLLPPTPCKVSVN